MRRSSQQFSRIGPLPPRRPPAGCTPVWAEPNRGRSTPLEAPPPLHFNAVDGSLETPRQNPTIYRNCVVSPSLHRRKPLPIFWCGREQTKWPHVSSLRWQTPTLCRERPNGLSIQCEQQSSPSELEREAPSRTSGGKPTRWSRGRRHKPRRFS